jgi:hypothetical protein
MQDFYNQNTYSALEDGKLIDIYNNNVYYSELVHCLI